MKSKKIYKLRHKKTGLYSPGGVNSKFKVRWSKNGKSWMEIGHVKNHLNLVMNSLILLRGDVDWNDVELVEYEYTETEVKPVHEVVNIVRMLQS